MRASGRVTKSGRILLFDQCEMELTGGVAGKVEALVVGQARLHANEARGDRQFAPATIGQHSKIDAARTPVVNSFIAARTVRPV